MAAKFFSKYVHYMESYRGRDKIIRTTSYLSCLLGGYMENRNRILSEKFFTIMNELNTCRVVLRLFDDAAMLGYCLQYGVGKQEDQDTFQRVIQIVNNIMGQAFYPIEHLAWAAEKKIINIEAGPWMVGCLLLWIVSLCLSITKCLWNLWFYCRSKDKRKGKAALSKTREFLQVVESSANLGMAVNWMPMSLLWAGKLSNTTVGALGVCSSVVSMIKTSI